MTPHQTHISRKTLKMFFLRNMKDGTYGKNANADQES
jgi:hypothetical protein